MTDYQKCCWGNCAARVPMRAAPVCTQHMRSVEPGICVDDGDQATTARRFIPVSDPECQEAAAEPFLRPRRAIRAQHRAVHEFGDYMCRVTGV